MLFHEIYGAYYRTMGRILSAAVSHPVTQEEIRRIIRTHAFGESALAIESAIREERWQLLHPDGSTPLQHAPELPLTCLEKRWLKSLLLDPRAKLFELEIPGLENVQPLFTPADYRIFDRYGDGDPYEDADYIQRFRMILAAVRDRQPLSICMLDRRGNSMQCNVMPEYLEYSEKDDKFRLMTSGCRYVTIVNLARIIQCELLHKSIRRKPGCQSRADRTVVLEVQDGRNALERVMLHFSHFEKEAEHIEGRQYRIRIRYQKEDETELVIRVLSFGPFVRVTEPDSFAELIRERLRKQMACRL